MACSTMMTQHATYGEERHDIQWSSWFANAIPLCRERWYSARILGSSIQKTVGIHTYRRHPYLNPPTPDIAELQEFLTQAERDASARAGDPFDRTPLTTAFADARVRTL